jgi:hypothetical protein
MDDFFKICVKLYANEPGVDDAELFVPIFHEWIRDRVFDMVLFDVADYAHVPDSPGVVLVTHETHFAMDRSDERFGVLAQRRARFPGSAVEAIATTLRQTLAFAVKLESDPRVAGKLRFDPAMIRLEANDRLRFPNEDAGFSDFEPVVRAAITAALPGRTDWSLVRVHNDPRDRLAVEVRLTDAAQLQELVAA